MKDKSKKEKDKVKDNKGEKNCGVESGAFVSRFDSLGGYTGNNYADGYGPEQDADDM